MITRAAVVVVAGLAAAIMGAGVAHADEAGFYDYLDSHGFNYDLPFQSRPQALATGDATCRYGAGFTVQPQLDLIREAAYQELCPS